MRRQRESAGSHGKLRTAGELADTAHERVGVTSPSADLGFDPARRLVLAGASAAVFLLGVRWTAAAPAFDEESPFGAWIRIDSTGRVALLVAKAEMGQGVQTALAMILAEELDLEWARVEVVQADVDPSRYDHLTVGSTSIQSLWTPLRRAGAVARAQLIHAAAARWRTPPNRCRTDRGVVIGPNGERSDYADLVADAAARPALGVADVEVRAPSGFRLLGTPIRRIDAAAKVSGQAVFGIDVRRPRQLYALVERCPFAGGTLHGFDASDALATPGVVAVFAIPPEAHDAHTRGGVAVLGSDTWSAMRGRERLRIRWGGEPDCACNSTTIRHALRKSVSGRGRVVAERGTVQHDGHRNARTVEAAFELPFLAHATLEPMNGTVHVRPDGVDAWLPTQNAADAQRAIARVLGLEATRVRVHQTLLGGGFGRRDATDFAVEAAQIAARVAAPIQLLWSREDDIRHDRYRPAAAHRLRATLDGRGLPSAWRHHLSSVSIAAFLEGAPPAKASATEVGGAIDIPYNIPAFRMEYTPLDCPVSVGWWRSVEDSINAFAVECFVDELATTAGWDPLDYRLALLPEDFQARSRDGAAIDASRLRRVLLALPPRPSPADGRARGIACHCCRGSYIAVLAEVSIVADELVVHHLAAAVDCGFVVNPLGARAQVEGGLIFGASAALRESITITRGRTEQSNFSDYPILSIADSPSMSVELLVGTGPPTGLGELGVPAVAPAIANAAYRLTGRRARALPLQGYWRAAVEVPS